MLRLRWPLIIWFLFLARVLFYCAALPLWEGYDEWAHFSVIRRMALRGEVLVRRESPVPFDVAKSLDLAPSPWALRDMPPPAVTHDAYWRLSPTIGAAGNSFSTPCPPPGQGKIPPAA